MKKKTAERIGVSVEIFKELKLVDQEKFDGVMVQLPSSEDLSLIRPEKDVDGLNPNSDFVPATVRAVERILDSAYRELNIDIDESFKVAVVGAKGSVGSALVSRMKRFGIEMGEFDMGDDLMKVADFKVVISCTGSEGLIKPEMVQEGAICIDVGFPKGDFEERVKEKTSFWTPVPGGVGPMTVISLMVNLVDAYEK